MCCPPRNRRARHHSADFATADAALASRTQDKSSPDARAARHAPSTLATLACASRPRASGTMSDAFLLSPSPSRRRRAPAGRGEGLGVGGNPDAPGACRAGPTNGLRGARRGRHDSRLPAKNDAAPHTARSGSGHGDRRADPAFYVLSRARRNVIPSRGLIQRDRRADSAPSWDEWRRV